MTGKRSAEESLIEKHGIGHAELRDGPQVRETGTSVGLVEAVNFAGRRDRRAIIEQAAGPPRP